MTIRPILGITMGDPAGIGPEIAVKALAKRETYAICRPIVVGDARVMQQAVRFAGVEMQVNSISAISEAKFDIGKMDVYDLNNVDLAQLRLGEIAAMAGHAAFAAVVKTIELALAGQIDATVTNPIHKEAINLAGHHFAGHTEIYAHFTKTRDVAMLLVDGDFRLIHISTHVPLRKACDLVKKDRILKVICLLHDACKQFGIDAPRIGVAGLNPHASDGGLFGDEEEKEILPAVVQARSMGLGVEGPIPPDIIFSKARAGFYDGCVAMYHDQGHIPFKMESFSWNREDRSAKRMRGVNITLGLPIIRTSVDHGTAFDIAGKGIASPEPLMDAIEYAAKMALHKK